MPRGRPKKKITKEAVKQFTGKKIETEANEYQVPVGTTDATKLALSLSNVGIRLRELESQMSVLATNNMSLCNKVTELERVIFEMKGSGHSSVSGTCESLENGQVPLDGGVQ